jgi:cellulose synthase/poly-beta-1,6-N-acetylglucosamine synthase-like glycosyltransferase
MLHQIAWLLQILILSYLTIQVAYLLFFSVAAKLAAKKTYATAPTQKRIRIFIPGYKEDSVIIATAKNALLQNYPADKFEIVVIADSFSEKTLATLNTLPIKVVQVFFEKSTKGKALQKAIEATQHDAVDILLILDADNHMAPDFLHAINNAYCSGYKVIQGHRTAKNFETAFAFLDACTEEINNHIFRRGHVAVGLPSALIGSGMAFDWHLFISLLDNIGETSGEDKEVEFRVVRQKIDVAFLDGAFVFDEKVAKNEVFSKQRSRWLATQVEFFEKYFIEGWKQLAKGNIAFFNKVFQTYLLPRVMLVAVLLVWIVFVAIFSTSLLMYSSCLVVLLGIALLMGIPTKWYNKQLLGAFLQIPGAFLSMIKAMFHIGKARKQFIHTPHGENIQQH